MSDTSTLTYPPDKVRITVTYHAGKAGEHIPAGQPETVEILLNDDVVPAGTAERIAFLTSLLDSLFRGAPDGGAVGFDVWDGPKGDQAEIGVPVEEARPL